MKCIKRLISGALALAMVGSFCTAALPAASAAAVETEGRYTLPADGSIAVTVRFDLPQTRAEVEARDITLKLTGGKGINADVSLSKGTGIGVDQVSVTAKNTEGEILTNEERIGYYTVQVSGLPIDTYNLVLTGKGYATYSAQVNLQGYSQHLVVGTGDGTFSLGDVDLDGDVDTDDLEAMDSQLGKQPVSAAAYDLNGDGKVDITDLAYINYVVGCVDKADVYETAAIVSASVEPAGFTVKDGRLDDLLEGDSAVTLEPAAGSGSIEIPITLGRDVEMSEIVLTSPEGSGALRAGTVAVELADGTTETKSFDITAPAGVHAIGRDAEQSAITIDLGRKVAVKKVTITVTAVKDQETLEFATLTQVEFLKDVVPAAPQVTQVKGLAATAGDGKVDLTWNTVNNVTGYTVHYGTAENALTLTMDVNTNKATVTGLTNETTYYFQVAANNSAGSVVWTGDPSEIVDATPRAAKAPGAPSNIQVVSADRSLRVSWGGTKDATYYQVFYRVAGSSQFTQFGGNYTATSAVITGLVNGTQYEVAVKAGNTAGTGPYSAIALGTPKLEAIEMPNLPEDDRIPNSMITNIQIPHPDYYNHTLCPNFTANDLIDNDAGTYWIARQWWESSTFTYTLAQPQTMSYLLLVPYLGDNHKYAIKTYGITAYDAAGNKLMEYSGTARLTENNYIICTFPLTQNVSKIAVSLAEHEGNGYRVSVSEIAFYSSGIADDIAALFADGAYTRLADGVNAQRLAELSAELESKSSFYLDVDRLQDELALAKGLLAGQPDLGLVRDDFQARSGSKDAYGQSASDLQPLGISARAGATVAVYAELPDDAKVYVVPTQYYGESGVWKGAAVQLTNGRNYITVPQIGSLADERGGMLYLTYAGSKPEGIRIQVRGDGDTFTIPVLELSSWYTMDDTARRAAIRAYVTELQTYVNALNSANLQIDVRNATEISTPSVLLSIPADRALAGLGGVSGNIDQMVETMYQDVLAWEDVLFVANKVQGIIDSSAALESYQYPMTTRQNIRYMRMFAGAFMYAAGNHVGVGYGSTSGLVCGKPVSVTGVGNANSLFGWGIAHEIGHNMDKLGKAEITNNIYSLAVQAWDGGSMARDTRLTASNIWPQIYDKVSVGRPGAAGNVFVQLGMYWQLHLAYDNAGEPLKFYNDFFKLWKAGEYSGYSYDERVALIACKVTNRNLTDFFTRWGMALGDGACQMLKGYPAESRAIWYLNDESYQLRLSNGTAAPGAASVSASVSGNKVTLTITNTGASNLLGYEVSRNGTVIGFTTDGVYVDDLGAANNLTYQYSVTPIDKLGTVGQTASSSQIQISYDVTIDPQLYTKETNGNTVTFTANDGTIAVTGIKVTGDTSGITTVSINGADVVLGGFSETGAAYFNRPADSTGSSIWTYDARTIQVTSIPADATVELLAYPGDRLDFYSGATVGVLKSDYHYGDGADDVIPAGTLIVTGIYRGDPSYNTVELQAVYDLSNEVGEGDTETRDIVTRTVNGYALLLAEINEDGTVGDTTDGFWIFVPDWTAENALNVAAGWQKPSYVDENGELVEQDSILYPMQIRAVLYRTNEAVDGDYTDSSTNRRTTSQTLWISFPDEGSWPEIELTGEGQ